MRKPILTLFYQFNPWKPTIGGIQTIVRSFIKYAPSDFEVRLVGTGTGTEPLGQWKTGELEGKPLQFMPCLHIQNDNVRQPIPTAVRYTAALLGRAIQSDFLHFHRLEPALAALPWGGEKTLFIHNDIAQQLAGGRSHQTILWNRAPWLYFALERRLLPQFAQILSCNSNSAALYQQRYPHLAERVRSIKNTVDTEVFYPLSPELRDRQRRRVAQKLNLPDSTRFVLFAGRLHPQKDPLLLVQAMAALALPDTHLLIAGAGELMARVQAEIAALGLSERITLLGSLSQAQLADLHRIASLFVLSSAYEGLPVVVLEALACGTPIVTTRCGETPHLLSPESGVVCSERTPGAIAQSLRQVLLHPEAYPASGCVQAAQPYGARTVIQSIYDEMYERWERRLSSCSSAVSSLGVAKSRYEF